MYAVSRRQGDDQANGAAQVKGQGRPIQVRMLTEYSTSTKLSTRLILSIAPKRFASSNNRCIDRVWVKGGGRSPDNDLSKDGHQHVHRIKSTNVSRT